VEFTEIGFAVALGVLLDTIVVRSVLVTALTLDLGRHIWWPSALSRPGKPPGGSSPRGQHDALVSPDRRAVTQAT
jgi:RND superfamily putative drug exporter